MSSPRASTPPVAGQAVERLRASLRALAGMPEAEVAPAVPLLRTVSVPRGGWFIRAGERAPLGFVASGLVRCLDAGEDGREYTRCFFAEGDFLTPSSRWLEDPASPHAFQALEATQLLTLEAADARALLAQHPAWAAAWTRGMERAAWVEARRISELMLLDAEERYRRFRQQFGRLEPRLRQAHVASYLGISPVSLSRIRARMRSR